MLKKAVKIITYGCQMNQADAERMAGQLADIGYMRTEDMQKADLIIINTCCVRESAEDKVYGKIGEIKHLKEERPELIFGIAGCMAQKEGQKLIERARHIDFVLGTGQESNLAALVRSLEQRQERHIVSTELSDSPLPEGRSVIRQSQVSAWIPIMYGCNNFCTYCIVPYVRGRERSRDPADIIQEIEAAAAAGYKEVTLLGQNVNSYGKDHKKADFAELLQAVDKINGLERIRYMTSHPKDLSHKVIVAIRDSRHICPHFHLPVQHGSDRILRAMNRVYTTDDYRRLVEDIRRNVPQASLTTDIIVGFPGETEDDFAQLVSFLREIRYDAAYMFLYSPRSGTPAAQMTEQVDLAVKKARLHELMDIQASISLSINENLQNKVVDVLAEGPSRTREDVWTGRTDTDKIVLWEKSGREKVGDMINVQVTQPQTWLLKGVLVQ